MAAPGVVILDTNVLIEIIRKNISVISKCDEIGTDQLAISSITRYEFLLGSRNREDFEKNNRFVDKFQLLRVSEEIDKIVAKLYDNYSLNYRPAIPYMIIAGTSLYHGLELFTLNKKDFRFIPGIKLID